MSVDYAGEFYASCCDECRVVVTGLYSDDHTLNFSMDRPVASIAIGPIWARKDSEKRIMTGVEDKVTN